MATSDMNKVLAALIDSVRTMPLASPGPGAPNIAQQILRSTQYTTPVEKRKAGGGGPSILGRVFDLVSRPGYAMSESFKRLVDPESESVAKTFSDFFSGVGAGLRGDVNPNEPGAQKAKFAQGLDIMGMPAGWQREALGFIMDVGLDPTTYIGAGAIKSGLRGAGKLVGREAAEKVIPKAPPTLSLARSIKTPEPTGVPGLVEDIEPAERLLDQITAGATPVLVPKPKLSTSDPADLIVAQKTAKEYLRKLKIPTDGHVTPRQQVLIFKNLMKRTGNDPVRAAAILSETEKLFGVNNTGFKLWEGSKGTLSDAIAEVGPREFTPDMLEQYGRGVVDSPQLLQAAEIMRARSAMSDSTTAKPFMEDMVKAMAAADATMSPAGARNVKTSIKLHEPELLLSPAGLDTVNNFIKSLADTGEGYVQLALNKNVRTLHAVVSGDSTKISDVTSKMLKDLETAENVNLHELGKRVYGNRAADTFAMILSTWYKNPQLRHLGLRYTTLARSSAALRVHQLNDFLRKGPGGYPYTQEQIDRAWRGAQGVIPTDDPLAHYFRSEMERLFSSSGIKDEADSVMLRSATAMKDLNTELARLSNKWKPLKGLRFKQSQEIDPITGKARDFAGINWLKSWETWDVKERPQDVIFGLQTAVESLMKKYALQDDMVGRYASKVKTDEFNTMIKDIPRLKGYYFPKEIADQIPVMYKNIEEMYEAKAPLARLYDKALGSWKRGVTIYVPSHHIRNLMGDVFLSWMAGVNNPHRYVQSMQVLRAMRHKYKGAHIDELIGRGATETTRGKGRVILRKNGRDITDEMIYANAIDQGLLLSARDIEDTLGETIFGQWKPPVTQGRIHEVASKTAEIREHYAILAHYIDSISKTKEKDLAKIFEEAAKPVRKWHPNGTDLTATERNMFRRVIPFYSWTRKAVPLVLESILFNPGKVAILPKGMEAAQTSLGIDVPGRYDPFPVDQAFPGWLREQAIGPIGLSGAGGLTGFLGSLGRTETQDVTGEPLDAYTVLGTRTNPITDLFGQLTPNPFRGVAESTNPLIQTLFELGMGRTISGREVGQDPFRYSAEKLPIVSPLYRIFNRPGAEGGKDETPWRPFGTGPEINIEALLNNLFAAGIVGTGPYIPQRRR